MIRILSLIILLFQFVCIVEGSCNYYQYYNLLGVLTNEKVEAHACKDFFETCTYVSLVIPGLVEGSFSGCPSETNSILTKIMKERLDIFNQFKVFINNATGLIDHELLCQHSIDDNKPLLIATMSGLGKLFVHCYGQDTTYNTPGVKYNPPTTVVIPANCNTDQGQAICTEGYCGMLELSSITPDGQSQVSKKYQYCPNNIINQLYLISTQYNNTFNQALISDIYSIGPVCVNELNFQMLSKNSSLSYFWYVNCYVPNNTVSVQFPAIPNLFANDTTTTTLNPIMTTTTSNPIMTTTKVTIPSSDFSFITITLFLLINFILKV
uniref:Transmembrane protein n=1 Tax=Strongyloides papillosus TaxID=174720 RepID=A0A0N5BJE9_STREA